MTKPWYTQSTIPAAALSLHRGALPHLVPVWLPKVIQDENEGAQDLVPIE